MTVLFITDASHRNSHEVDSVENACVLLKQAISSISRLLQVLWKIVCFGCSNIIISLPALLVVLGASGADIRRGCCEKANTALLVYHHVTVIAC